MQTIVVSKIDFVKLSPDDRRAVERRDRRRERERLAVRIESRMRWLVMFLRRPGGQSQFSVQLSAQLAERNGLREVQDWIADHADRDLSVSTLARQARMSPRNFARAFRREIGITPAAYVEAQHLEAARRLLETTGRNMGEVAEACGFARVETMQRAFRRVLRVAPGQYRRHFRAAPRGHATA